MLQPRRNSDLDLMRRCIALAELSLEAGEYPFAAVIARNGTLLCEEINRVRLDRDVSRHAETAAISKAQMVHGTDLSDCTLYSTVEPCAQCAYAIREARIGRVVYGLRSPLMGGHSRWNILADPDLSKALPDIFLPAPEIISGFLQDEVEQVFCRWSPLIWHAIKARGIFVAHRHDNSEIRTPASSGIATAAVRIIRTLLISRIRRI